MATPNTLPDESKLNNMIIIGDSRLDFLTPFQTAFTLTPYPQQTDQEQLSTTTATTYHFTLDTKYYSSDIKLTPITESDLVGYQLDPTSSRSIQMADTFQKANCAVVLFDITNDGGFALLQKLYTTPIHTLLTQVDAHILAGCSSGIAMSDNTVDNVTAENWSKWQNFSLDFNMQLIILDGLRYEPIAYHGGVNGSCGSDTSATTTTKTTNDGESDTDPKELIELDPSELGTKALVSAMSCSAWPMMNRKTQSKLNPRHTVKQVVVAQTNQSAVADSTSENAQTTNQEQTPPTTAIFSPPTQTTKQLGIPLLPVNHVYHFDAESMAEYQSLNDDYDDLYYDYEQGHRDENGENVEDLSVLDILDGSKYDQVQKSMNEETKSQVQSPLESTKTSTTEPGSPTTTVTTAVSASAEPSTKKSTISKTATSQKKIISTTSTTASITANKKKKPSAADPFSSLESIMVEASQFRNTINGGRVSDNQRRSQATSLALRLAQSFAMFDDDNDDAMMNSLFMQSGGGDDDFGLDNFGLGMLQGVGPAPQAAKVKTQNKTGGEKTKPSQKKTQKNNQNDQENQVLNLNDATLPDESEKFPLDNLQLDKLMMMLSMASGDKDSQQESLDKFDGFMAINEKESKGPEHLMKKKGNNNTENINKNGAGQGKTVANDENTDTQK